MLTQFISTRPNFITQKRAAQNATLLIIEEFIVCHWAHSKEAWYKNRSRPNWHDDCRWNPKGDKHSRNGRDASHHIMGKTTFLSVKISTLLTERAGAHPQHHDIISDLLQDVSHCPGHLIDTAGKSR